VSRGTAHTSSSRHLKLFLQRPELGDLLRRKRREKRWTQGQLAEYCGVRTQTVSAWERGSTPQRRFFGKIAGFLELSDTRAVEALLQRGDDAGVEDPAADMQGMPAPQHEMQRRVLDAVTRQLETGRQPSPELTQLFHDLLASVGLSPSALSGRAEHGNRSAR